MLTALLQIHSWNMRALFVPGRNRKRQKRRKKRTGRIKGVGE